jgi:tripeptide aminopeptidase
MATAHSSPLAADLHEDVLARLRRYAALDTQSRRERGRSPSTDGQLELGRLLVDELRSLGLEDAELDQNGYVTATLASSDGQSLTGTELTDRSFGLIAHLDTTPDVSAVGVKTIVHRDYDGGAIELPDGGVRLDPGELPLLASKAGHDIVTASGDTLLGADDKAGVAAIMAAVAHMAAHPELPRPAVRVAFTPDEEIGMGASLLDIDKFGVRRAYTVDGSRLGEIQDESFAAMELVLRITGVDVHPGYATGRMVSALRLASRIISELPADRLTPETTDGRQGFIHPMELTATTARAEIRAIVRDFDEERLGELVELFEQTARRVMDQAPRAKMEFEVRRQYGNMRTFIQRDPEAMAALESAVRAEGLRPVRSAIRGGTDGSQLSERGLPTPNIFTGGNEFHSVREWASVNDMASCAATLVRLAGVWAGHAGVWAGHAGEA